MRKFTFNICVLFIDLFGVTCVRVFNLSLFYFFLFVLFIFGVEFLGFGYDPLMVVMGIMPGAFLVVLSCGRGKLVRLLNFYLRAYFR